MAQIINTNIASLNAQRQLNNSQAANDTALQRLSSGLRINSAKDDAAGLAISTRFDSQVRGTNQAIRNAGDAISLSQTAEGALNSITSNLQRIRELSLQSANDTNTALDRGALQSEVNQLRDEISNIADSTNFNGKKLLDGSFSNAVFQTGANQGDTIKVSIGKVAVDTLGTAASGGVSSKSADTPLTGAQSIVGASTTTALVAGDLVINGIAVGASVGGTDTASTLKSASSSIAKAAAINAESSQTGVTATVDANVVAGTATGLVTAAAGGTTINIEINNVQVTLSGSSSNTVEQNLQVATDAINAKTGQTGVTAELIASGTTSTITLIAADGRNIAIETTAAGSTEKFGLVATTSTGADAGVAVGVASTTDVFTGTFNLSNTDGKNINITTDTGNIDNAGFEVGSFNGAAAGVVGDASGGTVATIAIAVGDLVINGVAVGASRASDDTASTLSIDGSAIAKAAAINRVSADTGVTATVNENRLNSGDITGTGAAATVTLNGVSISIATATADTADEATTKYIDAINAKSGQTGITAEALDADSFTLVAADGRNIALTGATADTAIVATTYVSSIALESGGKVALSSNTGDIARTGFQVGDFGGAEGGTKLQDIDITTAKGAASAITAIDNALKTVSSRVSELGAIQNRFENTISNLSVTSENLSAANSRIKDADFAAETAALSRSQVLQQAGISILSQANSRPQQVLSLLQ